MTTNNPNRTTFKHITNDDVYELVMELKKKVDTLWMMLTALGVVVTPAVAATTTLLVNRLS